MRVLLIEDNQFLAGNIGDYLALKGVNVDFASNGKHGLALLKDNKYDVISIDVMMPGKDGFEVCLELRQVLHIQTPVIFLTAKIELEEKMKGFEVGGDDYLTKPFELDEFYCRLMALSSRGQRKDVGKLVYGEIEMDVSAQTAQRKGIDIKVNHVQFQLLKCLVQKAPNIVSRQDLEYALWRDELPDSDVLRTHIYRLRSLLDKPFAFPYLETVHGQGFRIAEQGGE